MSMDQTTKLEVPVLSDSDVQWLRKKIGIKDPRNNEWKSADYVRAIDVHLHKNPHCQLNDKNADGNTPLHLVAISENYAALEALLMCGADVNEKNNAGQTPVTFSHACPDFYVGFQFFRHLHKLQCLGQHIDQENNIWICDVRKTYNRRYPRTGCLAAFIHNPSLDRENICKISEKGIDVIFDMYDQELRKIHNTRMHKHQMLGTVVKLTTQDDVEEKRLNRLMHFIKCCYFHKTFPLFGCLIKQKYRRSLEHIKSREVGYQNVSSARNLRNEEKRRMEKLMNRKDSVVNGLMNGSRRKIEQECDYNCSSSDEDYTESVPSTSRADYFNAEEKRMPAESSSDDEVEKMRERLARLPRPGL